MTEKTIEQLLNTDVKHYEWDTDKDYYAQKEIVNISGSSYSPDNYVTVKINGKMAARNGDTAMTCNDPTDLPIGQIIARSIGVGRIVYDDHMSGECGVLDHLRSQFALRVSHHQ